MNQAERRLMLIHALLREQSLRTDVPKDAPAQRRLLRALMNVRPAQEAGADVLCVQDDYLREETRQKGITDLSALRPVSPKDPDLYLWRGDITTLRCDAIVNAANSALLGCFCPNHGCIDNAIHTYAGIQLRLACAQIMAQQGHEEPPGQVKVTPGFNLPCRYVFHTVGPIVCGAPTATDCALLASCYRACLQEADRLKLGSLAFCCISTGEFRFPPDQAARIALETVRAYRAQTSSNIKVIFNVFKESDETLYRALLGAACPAPGRA